MLKMLREVIDQISAVASEERASDAFTASLHNIKCKCSSHCSIAYHKATRIIFSFAVE